MQSCTYSSNTSWITCKAKIIHHDRIFVIWTTSPYASENRSQYQKWQFASDKIDNVFISLVFFESYFGGKRIKNTLPDKSWNPESLKKYSQQFESFSTNFLIVDEDLLRTFYRLFYLQFWDSSNQWKITV